MIFGSPCPKCRHLIRVGAARCANCAYRPTPREANRAMLARLLWGLLAAFVIGILIAIIAKR